MALLGVARVLVADACATWPARRAIAAAASPVALLHVVLWSRSATTPPGIATATLDRDRDADRRRRGALPLPLGRRSRSRSAATCCAVAALAVGGLVAAPARHARHLARRGDLDPAGPDAARRDARRPAHDRRPPAAAPPRPVGHGARCSGTGELAVRAAVADRRRRALVPLLYVVARELYDRRAGLAAAALGAVAPFAVWYAQEARMYALFMLFALLAVWLQVRIRARRRRRRDWIGYVLAARRARLDAVLRRPVRRRAGSSRSRVARRARRAAGAARLLALGGAARCCSLAPLVPFALDQFAANEAGRPRLPAAVAGRRRGRARRRARRLRRPDQRRPGPCSATTRTRTMTRARRAVAARAAARARAARARPLVADAAGRRLRRGARRSRCSRSASSKPFVFEVRYFVGAVPLVLLLLARGADELGAQAGRGRRWRAPPRWPRSRSALADQQLNGSNPRVYDFKGAVALDRGARRGRATSSSTRRSTSTPSSATTARRPDASGRSTDGLPTPRRGQRVFVLGQLPRQAAVPRRRPRTPSARLSRRYDLVRRDSVPQIRTWEFRR